MISNQNTCKTYTVTVCIEVSAQFEVKATSVKNAKAKARELAENSIEVIFDGNCLKERHRLSRGEMSNRTESYAKAETYATQAF